MSDYADKIAEKVCAGRFPRTWEELVALAAAAAREGYALRDGVGN